HPLAEVLAAAVDHARATGLAPMLALTLLAGVHDDPGEADALIDLVRGFAARAGVAPRLSLIPFNPSGAGDRFAPLDAERERAFRARLRAAGVASHRRYSGGADVAAACGQLVGRLALPVSGGAGRAGTA